MSSIILSDNKIMRTNQLIVFGGSCDYTYHLEVNSCFGGFDLFDNDSVKFSNPTCTEKCCDSKSSQKIISVLGQMDQLANYTKDTLIFKGTFPSATYLDDLNQFLLFGEVCVVLVKQE